MGYFAFKRLRAQEAAAEAAASNLVKAKPETKNGSNNRRNSGRASANSYLTLAAANDYIDAMVEGSDVAAWASATTDQKNPLPSLMQHRDLIERFLGARATDTQALQWPRTGVRKPDTYINTYSVGFPFRVTTDYYTDTEIPYQIERARN